MSRYPNLPPALLGLLELHEGWQGTPTELYAALEPYRVEPWPANPVSLSLWLKHHAREHGIQVDFHHTGERRLLRLAREANGLVGEDKSQHSATLWRFATWAEALEALPKVLEGGEPYFTLAFDLGTSRISQTVPTGWLSLVVERRAAQFPQPREVRVYRGEVDTPTVWPLCIFQG